LLVQLKENYQSTVQGNIHTDIWQHSSA